MARTSELPESLCATLRPLRSIVFFAFLIRNIVHPLICDILSRPLGIKPTHLSVFGAMEPMEHRAARLASAVGMSEDEAFLASMMTEIDGTVAVVRVHGMLAHRCGFWGWAFGCCDTAVLAATLFDLAANDRIETVVLDLDTPGGDVKGMDSVVEALRAVRDANKRLVGAVSGNCHSCGVWLWSQCPERYVGQTGVVGAIGVMCLLEDSSEAFAEMGVSRILIASTKLKGVNVPGVGITDAQLAAEESVVMSLHRRFVADVAAGCGVPESEVEAWAESPDMVGAEAVNAGLATGVAVCERVLEAAAN